MLRGFKEDHLDIAAVAELAMAVWLVRRGFWQRAIESFWRDQLLLQD